MKKILAACLLATVLAATAVGCAQYDSSGLVASRVGVTPVQTLTYKHPNFTLIPPGGV